MSSIKASQIILKKIPKGIPEQGDFETVSQDLPELGNEQLLIEALYVSVDPYLRSRLPSFHQTSVVSGQVAKVIESKSANFKKGDIVFGYFSWSNYQVIPSQNAQKVPPLVTYHNDDNKEEKKELEINFDKIKYSYFLGSLGMPGATAYYGLLKIGELKNNSNVLVSGAAGAVGSLVGQIAKIKNCHVVGSAGEKNKLEWLKNECSFDHVINYKDYDDIPSIQKKLKELFPNGIDVYFDNTGGIITHAVWDLLNKFARVVICGHISIYNSTGNLPQYTEYLQKLIYKSVRVEGFVVGDWKDWSPFYVDMSNWITNDKISVKETVVDGFEQIPKALSGLFTGDNIGKMVVKVTKDNY